MTSFVCMVSIFLFLYFPWSLWHHRIILQHLSRISSPYLSLLPLSLLISSGLSFLLYGYVSLSPPFCFSVLPLNNDSAMTLLFGLTTFMVVVTIVMLLSLITMTKEPVLSLTSRLSTRRWKTSKQALGVLKFFGLLFYFQNLIGGG